MDLRDHIVVVVGLGLSGRAAARLALSRGARVLALDTRPDGAELPGAERTVRGPLDPDLLLSADVVVVSPGVPAAEPAIQAAIAAGVDVVGEPGFAARFLDATLVGITGTNGKSTVTTWTGELLAASGRRVFVGGNLGTPLSDAVGDAAWDVLVVELSSYQLELPGALRPTVSTILNLTPDHLARHGTMEAYAAAKAALVHATRPDGWVLLPDDPLLRDACAGASAVVGRLGGLPGVRRDDRDVTVRLGAIDARLSLAAVHPLGAHNLDHAATSAALALLAGASVAAVQEALGSLQALPHRMEPVHEAGGVVWIDDSKATNLASTEVAVSGLDRPAVVLLGGEAKGPGFDVLAPSLGRHRAVLAFGASGDDIARELRAAGVDVERYDSLEAAVSRARELVRPGDAVLLSPACASFDAFRDFAHRGEVFRALAREEAA